MNIGIIGLAGIGAAHAVAAVKAGHTVKWVMDIDDTLRARYAQPQITNSWGAIAESAEWIPPQFHTHNAMTYLPLAEPVDLLIIAVPAFLHQPVLDAWINHVPKVLVEKPAQLHHNPRAGDDKIVVNYEYTAHRLMRVYWPDEPTQIAFEHNGLVPHEHGAPVIPRADLLPHCLSVLAKWYRLDNLELRVIEDTPTLFTADLVGGNRTYVTLRCEYLPKSETDVCNFRLVFGDRSTLRLDWDPDQMARMYEHESNMTLNRQINNLIFGQP